MPPQTVLGLIGAVMRLYARRPSLFGVVGGAMAYQVAYNLFFSLSTRRIFDRVLPAGQLSELAHVAVALVAALVLRTCFALLQERSMAKLAAVTSAELRAVMFSRLQDQPAIYFANTASTEVLSRFSTDAAAVEGAIGRLVPRVFFLTANIAACTVLMALLDIRLAAATGITLVLAFFGPRPLGARAAAANTERRVADGKLLASVQEAVALNAVIRTFLLQAWMHARYGEKLRTQSETVQRAVYASSTMETFTTIAFAGVQVLAVVVGAWLVIRGGLSAGVLVAFTSLVGVLSASMFGVSALLPPLIEAAGAHARIEGLAPLRGSRANNVLKPLSGEIRFDDVSFSYTGEKQQLKNVSLSFRAGTSNAFVGPSGSGKSTLLSILTRANTPQSGRVLLDGVDLTTIDPASLYEQMSIVAQESLLFDASMRENIRAGNRNATDAEVEEAAKKAEIDSTIRRMPGGYDAQAGDRGGNLSGGQRQRVAIARAVLREPRLLVLDEATSALDPASEDAITATLDGIRTGRTIVSVTHRLATVRNYDTIFVLRDGVLEESGSHAALLEKAGLYKELWEKQNGVTVSADATDASVTAPLLSTIPLFSRLSEAKREELATRFSARYYAKGTVLFRAGDPGDVFYVVARGEVEITVPDRGIRRLTDGDAFGELALLNASPRTATAQTMCNTTLLVLARRHLAELIADEPEVKNALDKQRDTYLS